jgi:Putative transposase
VGALLVLHTWGQTLHHHPHVHAVVTGGGLSCTPEGVVEATPRWVACRPGFFLPVRVLSQVFRGKFLAGLGTLAAQEKLVYPGKLAPLADPKTSAGLRATLAVKDWVVYAKRPFGGPEQVLKYLAQYTHRVAISNARLVHVADDQVSFRYRDYADGRRSKLLTLDGVEFLRRFVQHVLPKGFVKIRHYGLLANRQRETLLARCRQLLAVMAVAVTAPPSSAEPGPAEPVPIEPAPMRHCPSCGGTRLVCRELPPWSPWLREGPAVATSPDTS